MIQKFVENIEKIIASSSIVLSSDAQKHFGPALETVYLKGHLLIIDSSVLEVAIFAAESRKTVSIEKYRLHYMNSTGQMLFRYDNSPHHPEIVLNIYVRFLAVFLEVKKMAVNSSASFNKGAI